MDPVKHIQSQVEKLVSTGEVKPGESIKIKNLPKSLLILLESSFENDNRYSRKRQTFIDSQNPDNTRYTLELKYMANGQK